MRVTYQLTHVIDPRLGDRAIVDVLQQSLIPANATELCITRHGHLGNKWLLADLKQHICYHHLRPGQQWAR